MAAFPTTAMTDISAALLDFYIRGKAWKQAIQERPFLNWLKTNQKTFPGGKENIVDKITGDFMSDSSDFTQFYSEGEALTFNYSDNLLSVTFPWKEIHWGFMVTGTELKKDGISLVDSGKKRIEHSKADLVRLTDLFKERLDDFTESTMRAFNNIVLRDGTQDSGAFAGLTGLISHTADPATVTTGGVSGATYTWWRNRALIGANKITASRTDQTLTKKLRSEIRQLKRYGGRPDAIFAGSGAIDALEEEVHEKGVYTQEGFTNSGKNDIGMAQIKMLGVGTITYEPTFDDLGMSKIIYVLDSRRITLRPMEGEDMKVMEPARPYNYMMFFQSVTWTGGMSVTQKNCHGVYEVA